MFVNRSCLQFVAALVIGALSLAPSSLAVQQGGTARYIYDDNGRLIAVILTNGEAAIYEYDAAGNFTNIRRPGPNALELLEFSPRQGVAGDFVTFFGIGFGSGVSSVSFNGALSLGVSFNTAYVVAQVPDGATTGPVTIATPRGSVTTSTPFTVKGVRVRPSSVVLTPGDQFQLSATVSSLSPDQTVRWSVNGTDGGNATVGSITNSGLYTAPDLNANQRSGIFTIRATSVVDQKLFSESQVTVRNPAFLASGFSSGVSVRRVAQNTVESESIASFGVSVRRLGSNAIESEANASSGVSVRRLGSNAIESEANASSGVSVRRLGSNAIESEANASSGVSVRRQSSSSIENEAAAGAGISVTTGPVITGISSGPISRGTTVNINVTGVNFAGVTGLRFINSNGAVDAGLTITGLTVNGNGDGLTATLTVSSSVTAGQYILVATTSTTHSVIDNKGVNTITVQ